MPETQPRCSPADIWMQPDPTGACRTGLKVLNSLKNPVKPVDACCSVDDKGHVEFCPRDGMNVKWYSCGPTVCDPPTVAHCRTYMTFDIVRRVMEDYFMYNVTLVMGVTDIDDKIIIRTQEIRTLVEEGWQKQDAMRALSSNGSLDAARETLSATCKKRDASLDTESVSSSSLAREMEARFFNDLSRLHIRPPTVITRVTEFIPSIISFVEGIIQNGFAYVSNGNTVFFDVQAFEKKHRYAKLMPRCHEEDAGGVLTSNCEGELQCNEEAAKEKRHPKDFILWRRSNDGEPEWESPWGQGRPGWHIECSAMASEYLGECIDLHTGCEDLRFPHHDNELAQSEARWQNHQWINYFLHHGNIHADAADLLPSNQAKKRRCVTIDDILRVYTPRQIRILFLLRPYQDALVMSRASMSAARKQEEFYVDFFKKTNAMLSAKRCMSESTLRWNDTDEAFESALMDATEQAEREVHAALCDNFDTPAAMASLRKLADATLEYIRGREEKGGVRLFLLHKPVGYVKKIFRIFGLDDDNDLTAPPAESDAACYATSAAKEGEEGGAAGRAQGFEQEDVREVIDAFLRFKEKVKSHLAQVARGGGGDGRGAAAPTKPIGASAPGRLVMNTPSSSAPPLGFGKYHLDVARSADAAHDSLLHSDIDESDLRTLSSGLNNFKRFFTGGSHDDDKEEDDDFDGAGGDDDNDLMPADTDCIPVFGGAPVRKPKSNGKKRPKSTQAQALSGINDLFREFEEETLPGLGIAVEEQSPSAKEQRWRYTRDTNGKASSDSRSRTSTPDATSASLQDKKAQDLLSSLPYLPPL